MKNNQDITESVRSLINIPNSIPIKNRIEFKRVLYDDENTSAKNIKTECIKIQNCKPQ